MRNALVVVESVDGIDRLVTEAGELAAGVDASLTLLHVTSESEFEKDRQAMEEISALENTSYSVEQAKEGAAELARDLGDELLGDIDVDYYGTGAVGDEYSSIMQAISDHEIDHVFIAGRKRSPSGKAIFGDTAQQVILNADCPVTILTRE